METIEVLRKARELTDDRSYGDSKATLEYLITCIARNQPRSDRNWSNGIVFDLADRVLGLLIERDEMAKHFEAKARECFQYGATTESDAECTEKVTEAKVYRTAAALIRIKQEK